MKKILLISTVLISCAAPQKAFKGDYGVPFETKSSLRFDAVWDNIIDMFAKSGLGIKIIDKSSGFIVAQNSSAPVTAEDKNGKPLNPRAWAITAGTYLRATNKYYYPKNCTIEWNIHIRKNADSSTLININLNGIASYLDKDGRKIYSTKAYSTGVFEQMIADRIK